jgi:hypothetical protein
MRLETPAPFVTTKASVPTCSNRLILTYEPEAQSVTADAIVKKVFNAVPVP